MSALAIGIELQHADGDRPGKMEDLIRWPPGAWPEGLGSQQVIDGRGNRPRTGIAGRRPAQCSRQPGRFPGRNPLPLGCAAISGKAISSWRSHGSFPLWATQARSKSDWGELSAINSPRSSGRSRWYNWSYSLPARRGFENRLFMVRSRAYTLLYQSAQTLKSTTPDPPEERTVSHDDSIRRAHPRRADGITRRQALRIGASDSSGGSTFPGCWEMQAKANTSSGGSPGVHLPSFWKVGRASADMWDLKPNAPRGSRALSADPHGRFPAP